MKQPHIPDIRRVLREHPEGMTAKEIHRLLPKITKVTTVKSSLAKMPDVYIDRWRDPVRGQWQAVWVAVVPPPNCPYPTDRYEKPKTKWQGEMSWHTTPTRTCNEKSTACANN